MTRPALLLGAIALLSALAGPASAQHVTDIPGWCAQFYPNAIVGITAPATLTRYGWRRAYSSYGYRDTSVRLGSLPPTSGTSQSKLFLLVNSDKSGRAFARPWPVIN